LLLANKEIARDQRKIPERDGILGHPNNRVGQWGAARQANNDKVVESGTAVQQGVQEEAPSVSKCKRGDKLWGLIDTPY
jgi:hypothetical protein